MAIKAVDSEWVGIMKAFRREYIADTEADVADLPPSAPGSMALVVESGKIYMVNASGEWAVVGG